MNTVDSNSNVVSDDSIIRLPCTSFYSAGLGYVGIRNNCDVCRFAVVNWLTGNASHVKRYRVEAHNQVVVPLEGSSGQLIGEDPC